MKKVVLVGVPHHCNLGDHAIALSEKKFIKKYFPNYRYTEIAEENVHKCLEKYSKNINNEDIIMLHGGGNLGNQYLFIETGRRKIVQMFPNNVIIAFPQTIFFHDTEEGRKEFEISKKIYGEHKKMFFMAREEKSYEIMKENFKNNKVFLTPDIVTILNETNSNENKREGALIILRNDEEAKVSKKINNDIEEILKMYFTKVERSDTAQGGSIMEHKKREKLNDMFDMYRSSELVVTDRLHGMIFAAITETPCIAFDNYNHKIKYTSRWFKHCEYIKYIENHEDLEQLKKDILILKQINDRKYDNKFAIDIFDDVMQEIMQTI